MFRVSIFEIRISFFALLASCSINFVEVVLLNIKRQESRGKVETIVAPVGSLEKLPSIEALVTLLA